MATSLRFDDTLGALFIGFSVSTVLYGMLFVQVYNYCRRYPEDKVAYKAVVMLLLVLETVHQAFIGHSVYYYSITNYLNILVLLDKPVWSLVFQLLLGAIVGFVVKLLFTLRVWRFSKGNVWPTGFLLLLNFGQMALAIAFTVKCDLLPGLPDLPNLRVLGTVALGISALTDIGIAVALCYYLQTMRSTYTQVNSLIRRLTLYAVNTGVLTSAISFSTLIVYDIMPRNFVFMGLYLVLSKLYAVSFVAALNTRQTVRGRGTECDPKKSSTVTDQQNRSFIVPLHSISITRDPPYVVSSETEENPISAPSSGEGFVVPFTPQYATFDKPFQSHI